MCGRYTITVTLEELMLRYDMYDTFMPRYSPKYNVAPGQPIMAIIHDGQRNKLGELRWGLIPEWAKEEKIGYQMLNARSETLADKPAFRKPFERKRCLIPADSFYDWKGTGKHKQPMRIMLRSRELFSMAGLYDTWTSPDGNRISTCTVITTESNEMMKDIHDRMPVILPREKEAVWLDRGVKNVEQLRPLLQPYPSELMMAYPVSNRVGNVRNDDELCIEPISLLI
ncbi:SOS response-associated peptidase [Paenibacillus qinlingensis]|uniref:Abasic site processing protein n=1 Tax=Paenibacillus qinlingensis TaxID=1837343 RepID=A0ABU1P0L6_9BACL|nr:SOS response-associated peptidase [Paenibacillus qinlingensis]MDR6552876.1 putative SOS response-associated peptidase YedK [Paenibacillus qinlingensis]